jgi:dipeptidyl aminopeptidase/acylaminoacyl peptidase
VGAAAAIGAVAVTGAVAATALMMRGPTAVSIPIDSRSQTIAARLTDYDGTEAHAALSPDGRSFVFVSNHGGTPDIWLRHVLGSELVRLTNDSTEEADLSYAPDGQTVYFTRNDSSGVAIWQVGALGGQPRKVLADAFMPVPAPDGRSLAYFYRDPEDTGLWALGVSVLNEESRRPSRDASFLALLAPRGLATAAGSPTHGPRCLGPPTCS